MSHPWPERANQQVPSPTSCGLVNVHALTRRLTARLPSAGTVACGVPALGLRQTLSPEMRRIEDGLTAVTQRMKAHARDESDEMLSELTRLAAELEANAALSLYRFGASRAYDGIVRERIKTLDETPVPGHETLGAFLERRLAPATCVHGSGVASSNSGLFHTSARSVSFRGFRTGSVNSFGTGAVFVTDVGRSPRSA